MALSIALGITMQFFMQMALGLTAFRLEDNTALYLIFQKLVFMLGVFLPVEFLPGWAQAIAPFTPAYWAMEGFREVTLRSGGLADVAVPLLVLAGFTVAFAVIAVVRFQVEDTKVSWA